MFGGYLGGGFPPGKNDLQSAFHVLEQMVRAHASAYQIIHRIQPDAEVGVAINYRSIVPARSYSVLDRMMAKLQTRLFNDSFIGTLFSGKLNLVIKRTAIPQAVKTVDFVGLNYYSRDLIRFNLFANESFL